MSVTCFVQCHHTDFKEEISLKEGYVVPQLKEAGLFDHIVLAAADVEENREIIPAYAKKFGVDYFLGSPDNVAERMLQVCEETNASVLVRTLASLFYIDIGLLKSMVSLLIEKQGDYIQLPFDFDLKFSTDVHSRHAIESLNTYLNSDPELLNEFKFRPWYLFEANPENRWNVVLQTETPEYSNDFFYSLRDQIDATCPIAKNFGTTFYYHEYEYALSHIRPNDTILDVAAGMGAGSNVLSRFGNTVHGLELCEEHLKFAQKKYNKENIFFHLGDGQDMPFTDDEFDLAVSAHTMEHIPNDRKFLEELARVLKPEGKLIIEVPLRVRKPFVHNDDPFMKDHEREYIVEELVSLCSDYFTVKEKFGVCRGFYANIEMARNAAMLVCINKK